MDDNTWLFPTRNTHLHFYTSVLVGGGGGGGC